MVVVLHPLRKHFSVVPPTSTESDTIIKKRLTNTEKTWALGCTLWPPLSAPSEKPLHTTLSNKEVSAAWRPARPYLRLSQLSKCFQIRKSFPRTGCRSVISAILFISST